MYVLQYCIPAAAGGVGLWARRRMIEECIFLVMGSTALFIGNKMR